MVDSRWFNAMDDNKNTDNHLEYCCLAKAMQEEANHCLVVIDAQVGCNLHRTIEKYLSTKGESCFYIDGQTLATGSARAAQEAFVENLTSILEENDIFLQRPIGAKYSEVEVWNYVLRQISKVTHAPKIYILLERFSSENSLFNDFLWKLERHTGQWLHFILLMYQPISSSERNMLLFQHARCITYKDFLLHLKEARSHLESSGVEVSERQLQTIWLATAGWAFPADLLIHKSKRDPTVLSHIQATPINSILYLPELYPFFREMLFAQMDEWERELLMKSAVDSYISDRYCAFLEIQEPYIANSIARIAEKSPYISCINAFEQIYAINPVLQSFLYHSAKQKYGEDAIGALHAKAAAYYKLRGDWKRVLSHSLLQGEILDAAYAFRYLAFDVTDAYLNEGYKELVRRNPISILENNAWVQFAYAVTIKYQHPDIALQYLDLALHGFRKDGDMEGEILSFCQTVSLGFFSNIHKSDLLNQEMLLRFYTAPGRSMCEDAVLDNYRKIFLAYAHIQLGEDIGAAAFLLKEAGQASIILQDPNLGLWVDFVYILHYVNRPESQQLKFYVTEALKLAKTENIQIELKMYLYQTAAFGYFIKCGLYEQARNYCEEARILAHSIDATSYLIYINLIYTYALDCLREFNQAEEILLETEEIAQNVLHVRNKHLRAYYRIGEAYHYYLKGEDWQTAFYAADNGISLSRQSKRNSYLARALLVMSSIQIEQGNFKQAEECITECLSITTTEKYYFYHLSALYQQTRLHQKQGGENLVKELQSVLEDARAAEIYHFNFTRPWELPQQISEVGINQNNDKYVSNLCSRNSTMFSAQMKLRGLKGEKELRFQLFGSFRCYWRKSELTINVSQKARYLLAVLAISNKPISVVKIIEELWPSQDQKQGANNFYVALHQLRKFLGNKDFIRYEQKRCWLDKNFYTTDVQDFFFWKKCGEEAAKNNEYNDCVDCFETALNLYRGAFLEEETLEGSLEAERYSIEREMYAFCREYGHMLLQKGNVRRSIFVLRKALCSEFVQEEAYRLLMMASYMLGERDEALKVYQILKQKWMAEMDTVPHFLSQQVYEAIKAGERPQNVLKRFFR